MINFGDNPHVLDLISQRSSVLEACAITEYSVAQFIQAIENFGLDKCNSQAVRRTNSATPVGEPCI